MVKFRDVLIPMEQRKGTPISGASFQQMSSWVSVSLKHEELLSTMRLRTTSNTPGQESHMARINPFTESSTSTNEESQSSEADLIIKLKHPNPYEDINGFVDTLPIEVMDGTIFRSEHQTLQQKRDSMKFHFENASKFGISPLLAIQRLLEMLKEHYNGTDFKE